MRVPTSKIRVSQLLWSSLWFFLAVEPALYLISGGRLYAVSAVRSIIVLYLLGLTLIAALRFSSKWRLQPSKIAKIAVFYLYVTGLSILLSPHLDSGNLVRVLAWYVHDAGLVVCIVVVVIASKDHRDLLKSMLRWYLSGTSIFLLLMLFFTDWPSYYNEFGRFGASIVSPTNLGLRAGLALLFTVANPFARWGALRVISAVVFGGVVILSVAKTVLVSILVSFIVLLARRDSGRLKNAIVAIIVLGATGVLTSGWVSDTIREYASNPRVSLTLTGRTILWAVTWSKSAERPLLGHGYALMEDVLQPIALTFNWTTEANNLGQAHNAYLDALFKTGIVGLLVLITFIFVGVRVQSRLGRSPPHSVTRKAAGLMIATSAFLLMRSLVEGHLNGGFDFDVFLAFALIAEVWITNSRA